jgi:hypothetical protein
MRWSRPADYAPRWMNGAMTDLGTLENDSCSFAQGINARRPSRRCVECLYGPESPILVGERRTMVNLNSLVVSGSEINARNPFFINDRGEIAAKGSHA